jgi:hypothetical protein
MGKQIYTYQGQAERVKIFPQWLPSDMLYKSELSPTEPVGGD